MEKNQSFIRWQGRSIEELGKFLNLILAISLTTIGFIINKLLEKDFNLNACLSKILILGGAFIILMSIILTLLCSYNRLLSFRLTARIARKREKEQRDGIEELRSKVKRADKKTWRYFKYVIILFGLGEILLIVGFIIYVFF